MVGVVGLNCVSRVEERDLANSETGEGGGGVFSVMGISEIESVDSSSTDSNDDCRESESTVNQNR